jgi:hypothetical protein
MAPEARLPASGFRLQPEAEAEPEAEPKEEAEENGATVCPEA